ncbi:Tol-Pal system subunit TolQ, partial [Candidatus Sumerlaeota bacterium]|nr:Tol-Pal system subunit TolQ [Candidatus Sumerlaeota bacterium]
MENQVIEAVTLAGSAEDLDFSIWALFLRADPIVKSVILVLLAA